MSVFTTGTLSCPNCAAPVAFEVAHSVNADRRPDLREAILSGEFQRQACPACAHRFRLDPQLTYLDVERQQWIVAAPLARLPEWGDVERHARELFDQTYGADAPALVRDIGRQLQARVVFGWPALREKILLRQQGLDDLLLELCKMALVRSQARIDLADDEDLRLLEATPDELILMWQNGSTEQARETLAVPRALYDEVAAAPQDWAQARAELGAGLFVDLNRILVPQAPAGSPA